MDTSFWKGIACLKAAYSLQNREETVRNNRTPSSFLESKYLTSGGSLVPTAVLQCSLICDPGLACSYSLLH